MRFRDREEAGRLLAARLLHLKGRSPVVLALPRGGVPVAAPIAAALAAPLCLLQVRKIGAPWNPEFGIGAVVDGTPPEVLLDDDAVRRFQVPAGYLAEETARQLAELGRRRASYGHPPPDLAGRTAIVVDDGIATGGTARVAARGLGKAAHRVLAVPVAPADLLPDLAPQWDEVHVLATPEGFAAVGNYFDDFRQISDAEVLAHLAAAQHMQ